VNETLTLAAYSGAILTGSLAGGVLPLLGKRTRSDALLSFSAGVMLGAAFFHMLPEAVHLGGPDVIPWAVAGFLFLFLLERFVLVHICAEPGPSERLLGHPAPPPHGLREHAGHDHAHEATGCDVHTLGLAAFVGLSLHTLVDGFALGAAQSDPALGLLVFVAILAHKIPSSVSLTAILRAEGYGRRAHGPGGRSHLPRRRPAGGRAELHRGGPGRQRRVLPATVALRHPARPAPAGGRPLEDLAGVARRPGRDVGAQVAGPRARLTASGSRTEKVVPLDASERTRMLPPWAAAICTAM
jgi:hypothetical protein